MHKKPVDASSRQSYQTSECLDEHKDLENNMSEEKIIETRCSGDEKDDNKGTEAASTNSDAKIVDELCENEK
eukprot:13378357-Ditylum_brightwellii.AAC.1